MRDNSEYRAEARRALHGNWAVAALMMFVYLLIAGLLNVTITLPFGNNVVLSNSSSIIGTIIAMPLVWGLYVSFLELNRGKELEFGPLFSGYSQSRVWSTMILKMIYIILWTLLLIIPGIIKSYSYALTEFIMKDNPEMKNNAAIEKSMEMMQGRKFDLFVLDLTFLGWYLLACIFTLGIGVLWVAPYNYAAHAAFYEDIVSEYEAIPQEEV